MGNKMEGRVALRSASIARAYFAIQAVAGAGWWVAVFSSEDVRRATLGSWDHRLFAGPDLLLFVGASALTAAYGNRVFAVVVAVWTTLVTVALTVQGLVGQEAGWGVVAMAVATLGTLAATASLWLGGLPSHWFFVGPFAFRVAGEGSGAKHLRRSLAQLVVFWTTFFIVIPMVLVAVERRLQVTAPVLDHRGVGTIGVVVLLAASVVGLWSCVTMALQGEGTPLPAETARNLVVTGPYRHVRNPMAVAGALQTIAVGLILGSWVVAAIAVAGSVAWNAIIRPEEEADLAARFGEQYDRYRTHVRCWVPASTWRDPAS